MENSDYVIENLRRIFGCTVAQGEDMNYLVGVPPSDNNTYLVYVRDPDRLAQILEASRPLRSSGISVFSNERRDMISTKEHVRLGIGYACPRTVLMISFQSSSNLPAALTSLAHAVTARSPSNATDLFAQPSAS